MTQRRRIIHVCTLCLLGGIVILKEDGFSEQEYDPRRNFMKLRLSDDIAYESKIRSRNDIEEEEEEEEEAAAAAATEEEEEEEDEDEEEASTHQRLCES